MFRNILRPAVAKYTRSTLTNVAQPKVIVPARFFSENQNSWSDFFKGKKTEDVKQEKPAEETVKTEEAPKEEVKEVKEEAPAQPTFDDVSKDEVIASARAKMQEYVKEIDSLKAQITKAELGNKENLNKIKELQLLVRKEQDEQEHIRERGRKDAADAKKYGVSGFCKSLLEGIDTLEMCLVAGQKTLAAHPSDELKRFIDGVQMSLQMFSKILATQGVYKYDSLGLKADPNIHFVTAQLPDPTKEEGVIIHVIKEGYMIHERVLRPAQVCVVAPKN